MLPFVAVFYLTTNETITTRLGGEDSRWLCGFVTPATSAGRWNATEVRLGH